MIPSLKLDTGAQMPVIGLGMWKVENALAPQVVRDAVEVGYRHFDCACDYGNEKEVREGLKAVLSSGACAREDLWVTSKLWNTYHAKEHVRPACEKTLSDLGLDYLDLYLVHFPVTLEYVPIEERYPPGWFRDPDAADPKMKHVKVPISETWGAMEQLVKDGLVKNIGICNFNIALIRDLLSYAGIRPSVLQVESHPYLVQDKLLRFCNQEGIVYTAFSPLGALSYFTLGMATEGESVMEEPVIKKAAQRLGKTPAQVLLRWGVQRNTVVIPKTSKKERLVENLSVFDFELSPEEMMEINALDRNRRFNDPGFFCEEAFNTFYPIYE